MFTRDLLPLSIVFQLQQSDNRSHPLYFHKGQTNESASSRRNLQVQVRLEVDTELVEHQRRYAERETILISEHHRTSFD